MRLEYEGLSKCEAVTSEGARWFNDPAGETGDSPEDVRIMINIDRVRHGQIRLLRLLQVR